MGWNVFWGEIPLVYDPMEKCGYHHVFWKLSLYALCEEVCPELFVFIAFTAAHSSRKLREAAFYHHDKPVRQVRLRDIGWPNITR